MVANAHHNRVLAARQLDGGVAHVADPIDADGIRTEGRGVCRALDPIPSEIA